MGWWVRKCLHLLLRITTVPFLPFQVTQRMSSPTMMDLSSRKMVKSAPLPPTAMLPRQFVLLNFPSITRWRPRLTASTWDLLSVP